MKNGKIGLKIVTLLSELTQRGIDVRFAQDQAGMIRLDFFSKENPSFYLHFHCGEAGGDMLPLEKDIIKKLDEVLQSIINGTHVEGCKAQEPNYLEGVDLNLDDIEL